MRTWCQSAKFGWDGGDRQSFGEGERISFSSFIEVVSSPDLRHSPEVADLWFKDGRDKLTRNVVLVVGEAHVFVTRSCPRKR